MDFLNNSNQNFINFERKPTNNLKASTANNLFKVELQLNFTKNTLNI